MLIAIIIAAILIFVLFNIGKQSNGNALEKYENATYSAYSEALISLVDNGYDRDDLRVLTASFIPMVGMYTVPLKRRDAFGQAAGAFSNKVLVNDQEQTQSFFFLQFFHAMVEQKTARDNWRAERLPASALNDPVIVLYTVFGDMLYNNSNADSYYSLIQRPSCDRATFEAYYSGAFRSIVDNYQNQLRSI